MIWRVLERRVGGDWAVLILFVLLMLVLWALNSLWLGWGRDYWKARAKHATDAAHIAIGEADSARAGASNASATRRLLDDQLPDLRQDTAERVQRIHHHALDSEDIHAQDHPAAGDAYRLADARILRELRDAEAKAQAATDRLRGTRAR